MTKPKCDCVECRIRAAIKEPGSDYVDMVPAIKALGNVLAECLAHTPTRTIKFAAAQLIVAAKAWKKHPRVMAQQEPEGHA